MSPLESQIRPVPRPHSTPEPLDAPLRSAPAVGGTRRTIWVLVLTLVAMGAEIAAGHAFGSMGLLADGWHMAGHAVALSIALGAQLWERRRSGDARYTFGTGKVGVLAGYTSALLLAWVAISMLLESIGVLRHPTPVAYGEALGVAVLGLGINGVCAWMLHGASEDGGSACGHAHHGSDANTRRRRGPRDVNLRAAYIHVLADALTSVLAIAALLVGKYLGWTQFDPVAGILGALLIAQWAWGLLRRSAGVLLDCNEDLEPLDALCEALESEPDVRVTDVHVWRAGEGRRLAIVTVEDRNPRPAQHYRARVPEGLDICHLTVEVRAWAG